MTNFEKITGMRLDEMAAILVYVARIPECIIPDIENCNECPFFYLCSLGDSAKYPDIEKWLESEVKDDA
uniref:Uncharacterized protein n=1 Tax=Siphoviridae sp. ctClL93 TaxID=2825381 RepID=A0A8S5VDT9_9CAUD|nr:MAG TPA: hypothetical protein [Siphoviridae sp. ctClL93]DAG66245.1 MAG TPA: hypothetical protein [Caudoviricetes sp.]